MRTTRAWIWIAALALGAAPVWALSDAEQLRALHAKVLRAHLESSVDLLLEDEAADYIVAGRGQVTQPSLADRRARLGRYLERTTFRSYRDLLAPLVTLSADATLGWVVVQVEARGAQKTPGGPAEPVEFVSAWIELYAKRNGRWYRVGNVSNFKE